MANPRLIQAINRYAQGPEEAALALTTALIESSGDLNAVGDNGRSHGPYQEFDLGRGAGIPIAQRRDPDASTRRFFEEARRTNRGGSLAEWAYNAQRPADRGGYISKFNQTLPEARRLLGAPQGQAAPSSGGGGAAVPTAADSFDIELPGSKTLDPESSAALMAWLELTDQEVRQGLAPTEAPVQAINFKEAPGQSFSIPMPQQPVTASTPAQQAGPSYRDPARGKPGTYEWAHDLAKRFGVTVSSTFRSPEDNRRVGGSATSAHMNQGAAADFSGPPEAMARLQRYALANPQFFREAFYDPVGEMLDNGKRRKGAIGGHDDHVHLQPA